MEDKKLETMLDSYKKQSGETWLMNVMQLNMAMLETIQTRKARSKLAILRLSTVNIVRILFLQTPFYATAFCIPFQANLNNSLFWLITIPVTLTLTLVAIWLYRNISLKNANRKWFKILFSSIEWTAITQSMEFIKVIDDFKSEQ